MPKEENPPKYEVLCPRDIFLKAILIKIYIVLPRGFCFILDTFCIKLPLYCVFLLPTRFALKIDSNSYTLLLMISNFLIYFL
uniref:Putative ovule protein n=1 Tax=Solanum chacoense TaxID=4108 RepID=A0A0V0HDX1_SOLCH